MAFKSAAKTRAKIDHPVIDELAYFTKPRTENRNGYELELIIAGEFLEKAGIQPGERCMLEIDAEDRLGRIESKSQLGWVIKPFKQGSDLYRLRLAWQPNMLLPPVEARHPLSVLQSGDGEIIFHMPKEEARHG